MGGAGKVLLGIFAIFLLLGVLVTPISDGIKTWRTNDTTESFAVTTAAAATTANVTLSYELFQASTPEVISITSNDTADAPVATSYVEATQIMLVSGLVAATGHTLTINYYAETTDTIMKTLGPFLAVLIIGGLVALILYGTMNKGRGR